MTYTDDQSKALDAMLNWAKNPENLLYTLNGAAGTGKTTIVKAFLQNVGVNFKKIAVTAPTHKAKKVIQDATDFQAQTIQTLLGLRPNVNMDNFNPNRPVFDPLAEEKIQYFKYVIIDESSMINAKAFQLICERAEEYGIKVLFLGDAYQLPPIGEKISKVFTSVPSKSVLSQIVRQEESNPMTKILKMLRDDVKNETEEGVKYLVKNNAQIINDSGYKCLTRTSSPSFGENLLEYYFSSEYEVDTNYIKFITYTNANIESWSIALREKLLKEEAKNFLNVGEVFTGYKTITSERHNNIIIQNSEDYIVMDLQYSVNDLDIAGYYTTISNEDGFEKTIFIVAPEGIEKFTEIHNQKLNIAKARRGSYWRSYYKFKNRHLLIQDIKQGSKLICSKDLYYGYGCTVHKSQGSTYSNVGLNLQNLYKNYDIGERSRLIYVALSRARNMNLIMLK